MTFKHETTMKDMIASYLETGMIVATPEMQIKNGGVTCDMLVGPCCCGGWHTPAGRGIEKELQKNIDIYKKQAQK